jgi:DNA-binding response OmpR family regulator
MRILYLEDNPNDANLVRRYIETTPHHLTTVSSIESAWLALNDPVDLIMVDIVLSNQRVGYSFVRELRNRHLTQSLIAVTALSTPHDIATSREVGFDYILTKPFQVSDLAKTILKFTR